MKKLFLALLVSGLCLAACSSNDCLLSNVSYVYMNCYDASGASKSLDATVTVTAAGTDSILINQDSSPSQFQLPLSYTFPTDTFALVYDDSLVDYIYLTKTAIPYFISMDCGTGMYYHLESVGSTHVAIDSVAIVNTEVNYNEAEHIRIYFNDLY